MALLTFIHGDVPLRKTVSPNVDRQKSYPMIKNVTSDEVTVSTGEELFEAIKWAAQTGKALMKGPFIRPLVNESRANMTNINAPSELLVLDFDGLQGITLDEIMSELGLSNTKHVVQYSSSQNVKPGLYAHVFMLMAPMNPKFLKTYLQELNLTIRELTQRTYLNKTMTALHYPLDIVTADNSRLLYIATPSFVEMDDPLPNRIELITSPTMYDVIQLMPRKNGLEVRAMIDARIMELLPEDKKYLKEFRYTDAQGLSEEVMASPFAARITGIKDDPAKPHVYLNLNGGDSWGYYYYRDSPQYLHNFKGEPIYDMFSIAPELAAKDERVVQGSATIFIEQKSEQYLFVRGNYCISYQTWKAAEAHARAVGGNSPNPKDLPMIQRVYRPDRPSGLSPNVVGGVYEFNTFTPSSNLPSEGTWGNIEIVLKHICVDEPTYERFINWLSYICQTNCPAHTAWIFTGIPGTGKGLMTERILPEVFGLTNIRTTDKTELASEFSAYVGNNMFLVFDEAEFDPTRDKPIDEKLKRLITAPTIFANDKFVKRIEMPNWSNIILTSNEYQVARISSDDRRYNIAPRQEVPLRRVLGDNRLDQVIDAIAKEASAFRYYLLNYPMDYHKAKTVMLSKARDALISHNKWDFSAVSDALKSKDMEFFYRAVGEADASSTLAPIQLSYNTLVKYVENQPNVELNLKELYLLYKMNCHKVSEVRATFVRQLARSGLLLDTVDKVPVFKSNWLNVD